MKKAIMRSGLAIVAAFAIMNLLTSTLVIPSTTAQIIPGITKPDLRVDNVIVNQDGKEVDITVVIKNIGNVDLTNWKGKLFHFDIKFASGDKSAGSGGDYLQLQPLSIPVDKTLNLSIPFALPAENGTLEVKINVDSYNDVTELNESNNEFTYKTILTGIKKKVPPCNTYGDVDLDNFVSNADAELVANYLVGNTKLTAEQLKRADVNGDSKVSIADALMIAQYVEGLEIRKTFPVCSINKKPFLTGIYPPYGTIGTEITIIGSGFTPTDNTVKFGIGYIKNLKSDGTKIRFNVTEGFDLCAPGVAVCPKLAFPKVLPDKYNISVINANGKSNTVSFTVTERNINDTKPPTCDSYGDVNQDGKISIADALLLSQYVEGLKTLSDEQKLRADADQDGGVTLTDAQHIADYLVGKRASFVACQKTPQCSSYGDVTGNGYVNLRDSDIITKHLVGRLTLTQLQKSRADVNGDGNVTVADVLLIAQYIKGIKTFPVCEKLETSSEQLPPCGDYGDIDTDSYVNRRDSNILLDYLVSKLILTQEQLRRADVTFDEKVTIADALLIAQYADGLRKTFPVCERITGTANATIPVIFEDGNYRIYAPLGSNNNWAKIVITKLISLSSADTSHGGATYNYKVISSAATASGVSSKAELLVSSEGGALVEVGGYSTIDTFVISEGETKTSTVANLDITLVDIRALPDGTVVGADLIITISPTPTPETPPTTDWIDIALKLEALKTKFAQLKAVALALADYYDSIGDIANKNKFTEIAGMFEIAKQKVENLEKFIKDNIDNIDAEKGKVKEEIKGLKAYLKQILLKILEKPEIEAQTTPKIESIYPPYGTIGTEITIIGSGFTPTDNTVKFGIGYIKNLKSDGTKIRFNVTEGFDLCAPGVAVCPKLAFPKVLPDKYNISVINANGKSNTVSFTVTEVKFEIT